jgi:hypothetical protein
MVSTREQEGPLPTVDSGQPGDWLPSILLLTSPLRSRSSYIVLRIGADRSGVPARLVVQ